MSRAGTARVKAENAQDAPEAVAQGVDQKLVSLQKDSAELRREQLAEIASRLVETEGIDAVKHARIAKIAGCTRSLVHHYFPKRSDIFDAIKARFYDKLDALVPVGDQQQALRENIRGSKENSLLLFGLLIDLLNDGGWGSMILRSTPEVNGDFASLSASLHDEYEKRWIEVLAEEFSLQGVDAELFYQLAINTTNTVFLFYRKGLLNKQETIEKLDFTLNNLLQPYRKDGNE